MGKTVILTGLVVGAVILSGLTFDNAFAAVDMFMKIDGVDGESADMDHDTWIDIDTWGFSLLEFTIAASSQSAGGGGPGKVAIQDMTITKSVDSTTSILMLDCCTGKNIGTVQIDFCRTSGTSPDRLCYFKIEMEKVFISSMSITGSSDENNLTETLSFSYNKIDLTYTPQKLDGTPDSSLPTNEWNIGGSRRG